MAFLLELTMIAILPGGSLSGAEGSLPGLVYVSPAVDAQWQSPETGIILGFDGEAPPGLRVEAEGSLSGSLILDTYITRDRRRMVFTPGQPLVHGEWVEVHASCPGRGAVSWCFGVRPVDPVLPAEAVPSAAAMPEPSDPASSPAGMTSRDVALPSDFPAFTFNIQGSPAPGNIFFSPLMGGGESKYLIIADSSGDVLFYRHGHVPFYNAEIQNDGCLSFINGNMGQEDLWWIELDDTYTKVDSFAVDGYVTDIHDFTVADNDNLLLIGNDLRYIDMSEVVPGGDPDALVCGLLIQEQDRNHMTVFQWSSFDHFEITDACYYVNLTGSYVDYVHCNSIDEDQDGGILVSCNAMAECTKIDRTTGDLVWRFGGLHSENPDFTLLNDPLNGFSAQHDFRHVSGNLYSVFDNGTHHSPKVSRGCIYELDTSAMTADLVWNYQSTGLYGSHMGSTQVLPNGNVFIGWGDVTGYQPRPDFTEVTEGGQVVFTGRMNQLLLESYRAYRFDWEGHALVPYLVALVLQAQNCVQLTYNVFGQTGYASYDVYRGSSPDNLSFLLNTPLKQINLWQLPVGMNYFAVRARDMQGVPTGFSNVDSAMVTWTGAEGPLSALTGSSASVRVYPNPVDGAAVLYWQREGADLVEVYDLAGRAVFRMNPPAGTCSVVLPAENLPAGIYLAAVSWNDLRESCRMVVVAP